MPIQTVEHPAGTVENVAGLRPPIPPISRPLERAAIYTLVTLYLLSACGFAAVTPYGEAPDENGHFVYIEHLVRFDAFPELRPLAYSHEAFQPPLYYLIGAAIVKATRAAVGTDHKQLLAPHPRDNPLVREGKSFAAFKHPPEHRWLLWPLAMRAVSILMGLGLVLLTYATARAIIPPPTSAVVPLIATTFAALLPQANFIRASVSNENLTDLMGAWMVWLLALHLTQPYNRRRVAWMGVAYGLAVITKLLLAPFVLLIVWALWARNGGFKRLRQFLGDVAIVALLAALIGGWFYLYRWGIYGDPLAYDAIHSMNPHMSDFRLIDLFWFKEPFRWVLWNSFWGSYGWQNVWLPDWLYTASIVLTLLAVAGCVYLLARRALTSAQRAACALMLMAPLMMYAVVVIVSTDQVIWQGREMYPALSAIAVLFGLGLGALVLGRAAVQPAQLRPWQRIAGPAMVAAITAGLLAVNVYSIFWVVLPALNSG